MALTKTPVCDFGNKAEDFKLKSIDNQLISLNDIKGKKATLIMFICNHCPYVKAVIKDLVKDCNDLKSDDVNTVAIMSNDTKNYPDDSFDNMIKVALSPFISFKEITLLSIDLSLKSSAFFPKSQTGVLVRAIMYYKLFNNTLQQYYDLRF